jgi:FixJ family two-component response regulator
MNRSPTTAYIVDDDPSVRRALERLLAACGIRAEGFGSVEALLEEPVYAANACVIADVRLPGRDGLDLPRLLAERDIPMPVIFVTAQDTQEARAAAKRAGAAAFFHKPVDDQALLDAIEWAVSGSPGPAASPREESRHES